MGTESGGLFSQSLNVFWKIIALVLFSVAISCFLELEQQNNASDSKSEHSLYGFELDISLELHNT